MLNDEKQRCIAGLQGFNTLQNLYGISRKYQMSTVNSRILQFLARLLSALNYAEIKEICSDKLVAKQHNSTIHGRNSATKKTSKKVTIASYISK